jgi:hypothetical protein
MASGAAPYRIKRLHHCIGVAGHRRNGVPFQNSLRGHCFPIAGTKCCPMLFFRLAAGRTPLIAALQHHWIGMQACNRRDDPAADDQL